VEDPSATQARAVLGEFEGYVSLVFSVVLSAFKAWLGLISGSISLLADAANNLADVGSSLVVALGFRWSRKPRDREHPYGHGRVEALSTLILSLILIGVAIDVGHSGVKRLWDPEPLKVSWGIVLAIVATAGIKVWLAGFAGRLAKATRSETLMADAWNHRFDILSTSLVIVALVGARFGWNAIDGWAGIGVSLFIAWTGVRFSLKAAHVLIGEAPPVEDVKSIERFALSVSGVRGTHEVAVHSYGDIRLISLHIEVDANLTVMAAHEMAEKVEEVIAERMNARVVVHVDPVDRTHPAYSRVEAAVNSILAEHAEWVGFHDLRVVGAPGQFHLAVDLIVRPTVQSGSYSELLQEARDRIRSRIPEAHTVDIGIESEYVSDREQRGRFAIPREDGLTL
jgi:cation diffusion facilitator family transporter